MSVDYFNNLLSYNKKLQDYRVKKEFGEIVKIGTEFINWLELNTINYNSNDLEQNTIIYLIEILNEILIGSWYANRKDLSKKSAELIEKNIYGFEMINNNKLQLIINNMKFNNINIKLLPDKIQMFGTNNYGDVTSLFLIEKLFKIKLKTLYIHKEKIKDLDNYVTMGSILPIATPGTYVWGSGYIRNEDKSNATPKDIRAVRGPLTRAKLITQHIWCPKVFGDPAFLFPLVYNPKHDILYKYGIIPHLWDRGHVVVDKIKKDTDNMDYLYIEIESGNRPYYLLNEISKCEIIIASSLHGIIIAAAYKKPFIWCKFSDKLYGKNFKFFDFLLSIDKNPIHSWVDAINCITIENFTDIINNKEICIDNDCLYDRGMDLLKTNPFSDNVDELINRWKIYCDK